MAARAWRRTAVAAAMGAMALQAQALVTVSGPVAYAPAPVLLGPGDTAEPGTTAWIGARWVGSGDAAITVDGGSFLQLARLALASGGTPGQVSGLITGTGTRVELVSSGTGSQVQRLNVGDWGNATLTVSGGAVLDTRGNQAPCLIAFHYCDSFVGSAAGDTAVLNLSGAGTRVNIGQTLYVAQPGLGITALDGYDYGVPGGTTRGTVNITDGALLSVDRASLGPVHWSTHATGFERNFAEVNVRGAGSRWVVTGGTTVLNHATGETGLTGAGIGTANDSNAWATINITDGGVVEIQGSNDTVNYVNLTQTGSSRSGTSGGRTDMRITGTGSQLRYTSQAGILQVGRALGTASLLVSDGGSVDGLWYLSIGRDAATGQMSIDGASAFVRLNSWASAVANQPSGTSGTASVDIGRGGTGTLNVRNGGQLLLEGDRFLDGGTALTLGRGAASSGTLNISGTGSLVQLRSTSSTPGGGAGESRNPSVFIGRDGTGILDISAGGRLVLDGGGVSTVANRRSTALYVGGFSETAVGGKGVATVSGAGSEIRVSGNDSFFAVGVGPQASGQLVLRSGAAVNSMNLVLGRRGGVGVLSADAATLNFTGQQAAGTQSGAAFVVADGGGVGVATLANGTVMTLSNAGSAGAGFTIGGSPYAGGGEGSLTLSGGSRLVVTAGSGLANGNVGRDGSGFLRLRGASSVDLGDGNLYIGRLSGSDGTVIASEGSTVTAGWVGVGARKTDTGDVDGGTGTFVLINSTLNAGQIVIGSNGFLGGTGTINGVVTNRGIFAPGNSPGRLAINGGFIAEAGSRLILEVESDGQGGFKTDELVFQAGQPLNLSGLTVEFRFLGATDPKAFLDSGRFQTSTFFELTDAGGTPGELAPAAFGQVRFEASAAAYTISHFSFDAATGAGNFTSAPVPEPRSVALLLAGLAVLGWRARRRG
ncbi:PEP-CTERM sorting domain-containing protein [Ideonella sp. DXS22W]|uniref:PEP-CTERM sorting domain-containing protein n=1 Tax=Pseudaquabacterium inlustre TaxID=2984192 RepID=A0ABU9CJI3_9BURK